MTAARPMPGTVERALFLSLGLIAVLAPLAPLGLAGGLVVPDLLYCLVVGWMVRRPATAPLWAVLLLGLLGDVMLSRPIGLGALGLVLVSEWFRRRGRLFHSSPFPLEWLAATLGFAVLLAGVRVALALVFAPGPTAGMLASYLAATALAYPLVVLGLAWCLKLRAPRPNAFGQPMGRLR
jgi:rod shape-determining protein MreD